MWATTPAADKTLAAFSPQGAVATHRTTLRVERDRSVMALTLPGLLGGVAISRVLLASDRLPPAIRLASSSNAADVPARAIRSAGAPWLTWVTTVELAAKLNSMWVPGWLDSKSLARPDNTSVRDDAASTTTVCRVRPSPGAPPAALHPATPRTSASETAVREATCVAAG